MNDSVPALGWPELVVPGDFGLVVGAFVAEQLAAVVEVARGAGAGFDEDVLVVVADLVTEVSEHGPVGLAEPHPQRLAIGVEGLDEIDRDHPVGMSDRDRLAVAVARQQIEGQAAVVAPERVDGQADVEQLQDQPMHRRCGVGQLLLGDGVVGVGLASDQRVGQAAARACRVLLVGDQPVAAQAGRFGAVDPLRSVDDRGTVGRGDH